MLRPALATGELEPGGEVSTAGRWGGVAVALALLGPQGRSGSAHCSSDFLGFVVPAHWVVAHWAVCPPR